MKNHLLFAAALLLAAPVFAGVKSYQVTGPVIASDATHIVVQKDKEKWEVARDAATKVKGDLKPGTKVTIQYTMTATTVTAK